MRHFRGRAPILAKVVSAVPSASHTCHSCFPSYSNRFCLMTCRQVSCLLCLSISILWMLTLSVRALSRYRDELWF